MEKNKIGYVACITTGTPLVHVAVADVSELTVTLSANTPPNVALAVYPDCMKLVPVKSMVPAPEMVTAVISGIEV